jgi:hypothetical protein
VPITAAYHGSVRKRLQRYYGSGYLHFITSSCYQRRAFLATPRRRDLFFQVLEQVRRYMHWNPVKRGLALEPEQWRWSSFRFYGGWPGLSTLSTFVSVAPPLSFPPLER